MQTFITIVYVDGRKVMKFPTKALDISAVSDAIYAKAKRGQLALNARCIVHDQQYGEVVGQSTVSGIVHRHEQEQ